MQVLSSIDNNHRVTGLLPKCTPDKVQVVSASEAETH